MLRNWQFNIYIEKESPTPIHAQIADIIVNDIKHGRLSAGFALPGSRALANKIRVNRKTVVQAYEELAAKGWLEVQHKRGTFVAGEHQLKTLFKQTHGESTHFNLTHQPQKKHLTAAPQLQLKDHEKLKAFTEFQCSEPDTRLVPFEMIARANRHALIHLSRHRHPDTETQTLLSYAFCQMLNLERGLHIQPEQLSITNSVLQSIYWIAKTQLKSGDHVMLPQLSHPSVREIFKSCGIHILNITHDNEGIDVAHIEQLCLAKQQLKLNLRAVYVMPHHHIPTAVSISPARRKQLLALAKAHDFFIIEDDEGFLYQFDENTTYPLLHEQHDAHIFYIGTLSKAFCYGVENCSFIVSPPQATGTVDKEFQSYHQPISALTLHELLQSGQFKKHVSNTKRIYTTRRKKLLAQIQTFNDIVNVKPSYCGLTFWLDVTETKYTTQWLENLAIDKIPVIPGHVFSHANQHINGFMLGFANLTEEEAEAMIHQIKKRLLTK